MLAVLADKFTPQQFRAATVGRAECGALPSDQHSEGLLRNLGGERFLAIFQKPDAPLPPVQTICAEAVSEERLEPVASGWQAACRQSHHKKQLESARCQLAGPHGEQ